MSGIVSKRGIKKEGAKKRSQFRSTINHSFSILPAPFGGARGRGVEGVKLTLKLGKERVQGRCFSFLFLTVPFHF